MDDKHFAALKKAKADNYELIYKNDSVKSAMRETVKPMMARVYERLLSDLENENSASPIFTHHISFVNKAHYKRDILIFSQMTSCKLSIRVILNNLH